MQPKNHPTNEWHSLDSFCNYRTLVYAYPFNAIVSGRQAFISFLVLNYSFSFKSNITNNLIAWSQT